MIIRRLLSLALPLSLAAVSLAGDTGVLLKDGDRVAFLGDSITHYGSISPDGYVSLVSLGLRANGINISVIPAGIPGNKAHQMLARIDKDVVQKQPTWMTLSCGVNDVWFYDEQSTLEKFREQVPAIVAKARAAGIRVLLLTPTTAMGEAPNPRLETYCEFLRQYAKENDLPLADTGKDIVAAITSSPASLNARGLKVTVDGVHMAPIGNRIMARSVLRAFGLDEAQLAAAEKAWSQAPERIAQQASVAVTFPQYDALERLADQRQMKLEDLYSECLERGLNKMGLPETASKDEAPAGK